MHSRLQTRHPLTIGWIPYWNLRPLRTELQKSWGDALKLIKGHPSEINRLMESGEISCAPSSSINLLLNPNLEIALPAGVASNGEVLSVYLAVPNDAVSYSAAIRERTAEIRLIIQSALEQHPDETRKAAKVIWERCDSLPPITNVPPTLELSSNSASGAMLSRILYRMYFGLDAYNRRASEGNYSGRNSGDSSSIRLVIGDQALIERPTYSKIIDLGSWWFEITGLPFVYAVWQQSRSHSLSQHRTRLMECINLAQAKMKVEPSDYLPTPVPVNEHHHPIDLAAYWKRIHYRLGTAELRSMLMFFGLSRSFLNADLAEKSAVRILRWREQVGTAAWH